MGIPTQNRCSSSAIGTRIFASLIKMRRYRVRKALIPIFLIGYAAMIPLHSVIESDHDEIFPFFGWSLFSSTPGWYTTENTISVNSVDEDVTRAVSYVIPAEARDNKALRRAVNACTHDLNCDEVVEGVLYPIVRRLLGVADGTSVDFTITRSRIDLRDVQRNIGALADETVTRADFYQPDKVIGRWDTSRGRIKAE